MEPEDRASRSNSQAIAAQKSNALIPRAEYYKQRSPEPSFVSPGTLMDFSLLRLRNWPHTIKFDIQCAISLKQRLTSTWNKSNYFQFSRFVFSTNSQGNTLPCTGLSVSQSLLQMAILDEGTEMPGRYKAVWPITVNAVLFSSASRQHPLLLLGLPLSFGWRLLFFNARCRQTNQAFGLCHLHPRWKFTNKC